MQQHVRYLTLRFHSDICKFKNKRTVTKIISVSKSDANGWFGIKKRKQVAVKCENYYYFGKIRQKS